MYTASRHCSIPRPGRLWWLAKRDWERGLAATWHDYITRPRIARWRCPDFGNAPGAVPVHVLVGSEQAFLAAWMLASWHLATQRNWRIVLHDDGTLTPENRALLASVFPKNLTFISRAQADAVMRETLAAYPRCRKYRESHPLALKIFDIPALTQSPRFLLLDSDLVFFRRPQGILDWVDSESAQCLFNEDIQDGSLVSAEEAKATLKVTLLERVNSGLCLVSRDMIDLDFCERCFTETKILEGHFWRVEQTLYALCASRYGHSGLLPSTYEVSQGKNAQPDCVCRHYVGSVRQRFFAEGIARIAPMIFSETCKDLAP